MHNLNHLMTGYWAGVYSQADRVDLEDALFTAVSPYLFLAYSDAKGDLRFAAAGSQVRKLLGQVVGRSYSTLWDISERHIIKKLLGLSWETNEPLCFTAKAGLHNGLSCELECALFPVRQRDSQITCYIGLFSPLRDVAEQEILLPLKFIMSEKISDAITSEGSTVIAFKGRTA